MSLQRIERFFTTCIDNSNRLECFADRWLLAPLHYLLTQRYGPDRIAHYRIEGSRVEWIPNPELAPDTQGVRIRKIVCAAVGTVVFTIPGALLKLIAQCAKSSQVLHRALNDYRTFQTTKAVQLRQLNETVLNDAKGSVLCCVAAYVSLKSVGALFSVCKTWNGILRRQELPLWRAVVLRFPDYREQQAAHAGPPMQVAEIQNWIRTAFRNAQRMYAAEGFKVAFGDVRQFLLMPCVKTKGRLWSAPNIPIQQLPSAVFRTIHSSLPNAETDFLTKGITLRIVRTLTNTVTLPARWYLPQQPEKRTLMPGTELARVELNFTPYGNEDPSSPLIPKEIRVQGDLLWEGLCFEEKDSKGTGWLTGDGLRWLQDLLSGKTCGPFPGTTYMGSPAPQVSYRLWQPMNANNRME